MRGEGLHIHVRLMDLDYATELSDTTIDRLEEAARAIGLPLRELELIGQDPALAARFVARVEQGEHDAFLDAVEWHRLEALLYGTAEPGAEVPDARPATA